MIYDVIVVGGGAAGLLASLLMARGGKTVLLIEKNDKMGRKLRITGKGRCNLCNNCTPEVFMQNITTNSKFMYSSAHGFTPSETMEFFESLGVPLKTERGNRVFPVSDSANEVADALVHHALESGVKIIKGNVTGIIKEDGQITGVKLDSQIIKSENVIIATGGVSYKATGSTGDGYKFAKNMGHSVISPKPSLIALTSDDEICPNLQGLSLKNSGVKLVHENKTVFEDLGELLFTHFGLSGPTILSASAHMKDENGYKIIIDLKPGLDTEKLDKKLVREWEENSNKNFDNYLGSLLPRKMIDVICGLSGIEKDRKCHSINKKERKTLINTLKTLTINISGFRPINEAVITRGGINVKEVNPKTMESKLVSGLYFIGEVIDVDAYTGGFNLQIAFSSAYAAANSIINKW